MTLRKVKKGIRRVDAGKAKPDKSRRAICVKQPYAWFIINGYKDVENRNNPPAKSMVGRRIYIHASQKKVTKIEFDNFLKKVRKFKIKSYPKTADEFIYGAIVGSVVLDGSKWSSGSYWAIKGLCHWCVRDPKKCKALFMRGKEALFWKF